MFDLPSYLAGVGSTMAVVVVVATVFCHLAGRALAAAEWHAFDE